MEASLVFQIVNTLVLPAWIVLIFFPKKAWRNPVIYTFAALMASVYAFYVISHLGNFNMEAFSQLEGIKSLFSTDQAVLTGWIHYLVFDLLVGNWIVNNAQKTRYPITSSSRVSYFVSCWVPLVFCATPYLNWLK
ncbi:ABA4-like family protein [Psychroflexus planctonicus]|uniref:ABA4-like family protein n=1 Tax=Psychroflexus planctonicus TaxID=1526575 RepID=UPI001E5AE3B2|nr:ABA4-like family protein [Psychroflexus planctonicus]